MVGSRANRGGIRVALFVSIGLLFSAAGSLVLHQPAHADTPTYYSMNPDERAKSYSLYYAMQQCFSGINSIGNNDVINTSVRGGDTINSWYLDKMYGDGADGNIQCSTAEQAAVTLWGYGTFDQMVIDFGYINPGNGGDWTNDNPGTDIGNALRNRVYGGSNPTFGGAEQYVLFRTTLESTCKISEGVDYSTASPSLKSAVDGRTTQYVKLTEPTANFLTTVDKIYKVDTWRTVTNAFPSNAPLSGFYDCKALAAKASQGASAFQRWAQANPELAKTIITSTAAASGAAGQTATKTCSDEISGVGWIVCPVFGLLAKLNDGMFNFLSNAFLSPKAELFNTSSGTYVAWSVFRNYANIAFVIVFLVIIYSQVTSAGINNYGIKRMLPRLIIAAILVNVSFYLCQLAIDVSNILGYGIKALFDSIPIKSSAIVPTWASTIAAILVAGGAIIGLFLVLSGSVLVAAVLAFAMIVIIMVLREAAIVLLVAISPLAFVAYLLPNTEDMFKKWWKMFSTLLMVFPVVSLIFGASMLASKVLAASGNMKGTDTDSITLQLTSLAMIAVPLFVVPIVLKGSMAATGKLGGKLQGMGDRATGRLNKSSKGMAKTRYDRSSFAQGRALKKAGEDKYRRSQFASRVAKGGVRGRIARGFAITPTQRKGKEYLTAAAIQADFKAFDEQVAAEKSLLSQNGVVAEDIGAAAAAGTRPTFSKNSLDGRVRDTSLSAEQRSAAASRLIQTGSDSNIQEMLDYLGTTSDAGADTIQKQVAADIGSRKPKSLGNADISSLATGTYGKFSEKDKDGAAIGTEANFDSKVIGRIEGGKQSGEALASASADELRRMAQVLSTQPRPAAGTDRAMHRAALAKSIDDYYTSVATSGRQVPSEIKAKMDSIKAGL